MPKDGEKGKSTEGSKQFEPHEHGIALAFEEKHRDELKFCHSSGKWYRWTGTHWQKDKTLLAFDYARAVVAAHNLEEKATLAKAATACGVESLAKAARAFAATADTWDQDLYLLGTPGGTVDLRTGELRAADRADFITKQTAVAPAPGPHPKWSAFLEQATKGDKDLQRYLQQVAGYSLTGDVSEHALFFIYGDGTNGKGVFVKTVSGVLGDYATVASMETFTASKYQQHPTEIAKLAGCRLVTAQETEEGRRWAESRIKALTGGDTITARFMRQDYFDFMPQFKLVFTGNHKPELRNVGEAERRRFNIIPFTHKPEKPDPKLEEALKEEWPQILQWCIDGCLDWQENGLVRPDVVIEETNEYFSQQDTFQKLLDACCETLPKIRGEYPESEKEYSSELFQSWKNFAEKAGEYSGNEKKFNENMRVRGYVSKKRTTSPKGRAEWLGIRFRPAEDQQSPDQEQRSPEAMGAEVNDSNAVRAGEGLSVFVPYARA